MQARSKIHHLPRPRTFTAAEDVVQFLAQRIITDPRGYEKIAEGVGISKSTVGNIANGTTKWPRPNTLFGLLGFYNVKMRLE